MLTLDAAVAQLAKLVDEPKLVSTTSASLDGTHIIASSLIWSDTNEDGSSAHGNAWLYALRTPLFGEQRQVKDQGFTRSTGKLSLTRAFSGTPATSKQFAMYRTLPRITGDNGEKGYVDAVNLTLGDLFVEDIITLTGTASGRIDLTSTTNYGSWLYADDRIGEIYYHRESGDERKVSPATATIQRGGSSLSFVLDRPRWSGETFEVQVWRPARSYLKLHAEATATIAGGAVTAITVVRGGGNYGTTAPTVSFSGGGGSGATATATLTSGYVTSIAVGAGGSGYTTEPIVVLTGAWGEVTPIPLGALEFTGYGDLASPYDETLAPADHVIPVALWHCYDFLAQGSDGKSNEHWLAMRKRARGPALRAINQSMPRVVRPRTPKMVYLHGGDWYGPSLEFSP